MGRRNFPCSTVNAQTVKSIGARSFNSNKASSIVTESLPPESATATRSPSRIILKRVTASPTLCSNVFSSSKPPVYGGAAATVELHGEFVRFGSRPGNAGSHPHDRRDPQELGQQIRIRWEAGCLPP